MDKITFSKDFKFGVATASTQIEGGDTNNTWYEWTKDGKNTKDGTTCFRANNHWNKYKEHIDLMKDFNIQIYRLSLEWSRIEPKEGEFNKEAMEHYIDEIKYMKSKGIEPLVTLHHFSNPIWFEKLGGFKKKKCVFYFERYTRYVAESLKGLVDEFCTINEPNVYAVECFLFGEWINQQKNFFTCMSVMRHLADSHIAAYKTLHEVIPECKVGIACNMNHFIPKNPNKKKDVRWAKFYNQAYNEAICYAMGQGKLIFPLGKRKAQGDFFDYFGVNYYITNTCDGSKMGFDPSWPVDDMNRGTAAFGFRAICEHFHSLFPAKPIYITENGTCDRDDSDRCQFLYDHLKAIHDLDYVKRFYQWSFLDNFEWNWGEDQKFGLVEYDYENDVCKPRRSCYMYSEVITNNGFTDEIVKKYEIKEN